MLSKGARKMTKVIKGLSAVPENRILIPHISVGKLNFQEL